MNLLEKLPAVRNRRARGLARLVAVACVTAVGLGLLAPTAGALAPAPAAPAAITPLTNLAHLNFLGDRVPVVGTAAHSTYHLAQNPTVGVLWVYADSHPDGTFTRVGGGKFNATTNRYGQGAFDADDISRAAVVYLRQWRATGSVPARDRAYQLLRGLAYFQTLTGPHKGDMVLWMQPDGTLNPSPTPADSPQPSDRGPSYWVARSIWAYGEGYAAFARTDPHFAAFLKWRMDLAVAAVRREVIAPSNLGTQVVHGVNVPSWLIVNGADASSEAMLGLAAYYRAGGGAQAYQLLSILATGVAGLSAGSTTNWPFRALLPWALSRSDWHAWGSNMAAALAAASVALPKPGLLRTAIADTAGFSAQLLTSTGPVNGLLPGPSDATTIAYGADTRVQGLHDVGVAAGSAGIRSLAGVAAGWFFGQNASGKPVYDPATGVTRDGVQPDGTVNQNSGAESTIHGLLSMQVLDANPDLAVLARSSAAIDRRDGLQVVEAETGTLAGPATVVTPPSQWTGESLLSGQQVHLAAGGSVTWTLPAGPGARLIAPVVELTPSSPSLLGVTSGATRLGLIHLGSVGAQGVSSSPTMLSPVTLGSPVGAGATTVRAVAARGPVVIDQLLVMPEVATLAAHGNGHAVTLLTSKASALRRPTVSTGGSGGASWTAYDRDGAPVSQGTATGASIRVDLAPGGFTLLTR